MLIPVSLANLIKAPPKNHSTHGCRAILLHNRAFFGHNTQIISISKKVCCALFTQNCASFSTLLHLKPRLDPEFSPKTRQPANGNSLHWNFPATLVLANVAPGTASPGNRAKEYLYKQAPISKKQIISQILPNMQKPHNYCHVRAHLFTRS